MKVEPLTVFATRSWENVFASLDIRENGVLNVTRISMDIQSARNAIAIKLARRPPIATERQENVLVSDLEVISWIIIHLYSDLCFIFIQ